MNEHEAKFNVSVVKGEWHFLCIADPEALLVLTEMLFSHHYLQFLQEKYTGMSRHCGVCAFRFFLPRNRKPSIFVITLKYTQLVHSSKLLTKNHL